MAIYKVFEFLLFPFFNWFFFILPITISASASVLRTTKMAVINKTVETIATMKLYNTSFPGGRITFKNVIKKSLQIKATAILKPVTIAVLRTPPKSYIINHNKKFNLVINKIY